MVESFQSEKYSKKAVFAKEIIEENTGETVEEFVERHDWSISNGLCRRLLDDELTEKDLDELSVLDNLDHLKDNRSNPEYGMDLVLGWLLEDLLSEMIEHSTSLDSADKDREFLKSPDADSDLEISIDGQKIPLEIVNDYTGFWKREGEMSNLRDGKFENLKDENALILGLDMENRDILIIPAKEADKTGKEYNYLINKEASIINLEDEDFHDLDDLNEVISKKIRRYK